MLENIDKCPFTYSYWLKKKLVYKKKNPGGGGGGDTW